MVPYLTCDGFRIITVSKRDRMVPETKHQILSHNEFLEECRVRTK